MNVCGLGEAQDFVRASDHRVHPALELAAHDTHERNPVSMARVHVRLDLENEACETIFVGLYLFARFGCARPGRGSFFCEKAEELFDAEVAHGRPPEKRAHVAGKKALAGEHVARMLDELELFRDALEGFGADEALGPVEVGALRLHDLASVPAFGFIKNDFPRREVPRRL